MSDRRPLCMIILGISWGAATLFAPDVLAVGPDITTGEVWAGFDGPTPCVATWGPVSGIYGFVNGITACNISVDTALPGDCCGPTQNLHPAVAFHLYQLKTSPSFERFQQIGMSWIHHDDWFLEGGSVCGGSGCTPSGTGLGAGCSDTYSIPAQAFKLLGPRWSVNAFTGEFPMSETVLPIGCGESGCCPNPSTFSDPEAIRGYLHANSADLPCPPTDAFFLEAQFVTPGESAHGNQFNNVSYVESDMKWVNRTTRTDCNETCGASACIWWLDSGANKTVPETPAIYAWKKNNDDVVETQIDVDGEGRFILAALATSIGSGWWSYEYALYNMNSDRSADGFRVALPAGLVPPDVRFPINPADGFTTLLITAGTSFNSMVSTGTQVF